MSILFSLSSFLSPWHTLTIYCSLPSPTSPATPPTGEGPPAMSSLQPAYSEPRTSPDRVRVARNLWTSRATSSHVCCRSVEPPRRRPSSAQPRLQKSLAASICTWWSTNQLRWRLDQGAARASLYAAIMPRKGCRKPRLCSSRSERTELSWKWTKTHSTVWTISNRELAETHSDSDHFRHYLKVTPGSSRHEQRIGTYGSQFRQL